MDWLKLVRTWSLPGVLLGGIFATALLPIRSPEAHGAAQAPPGAPTAPASEVVQQARGLFEAAKYPEVLRLASTELAKTKPMGDGKSNERYELLLLKGESFLRMNQRNYAADAFEQAVRAAPDIREGAIARATSLLVRKSKQNRYEPATKAAAIDILSSESRPKAFDAMHEDMKSVLKAKLAAAQSAKTLPPITDAVPMVLDLASVEFAGKGSAPEGREALGGLGEQARELISADLRRLSYRTDSLASAADSLTSYDAGVFQQEQIGRRGLTPIERKELEGTTKYLRQIEEFARGARRRARELGFDGKVWEPFIAEAGDEADHVAALLAAPR